MAAVLNKRDVALQSASPRTLSNDLSDFRTTGAPTNLPVIGLISTSLSTVGTVDITLSWTYTQGAIEAQEFILYYAEGTVNPTTSSPILAKVNGSARSITIPGVPIEKSYRAGIVASRVSAAGVESTAIVNSWARTGTAANITANINGTSASTITGHVSATGNVHNVDLSQITGDLDDISNGVTYFRTTSNQVTGAGRAYGALDSSNEYVKSLTSTKLTVVGANPSTGWVGDTNGIRMYQSGVLKVNIPVSGSPSFTGDISGGSNINITGQGRFGGSTTEGGVTYAGVFNASGGSTHGVGGWSTTGLGIWGNATSGSGVFGSATTGTGVKAQATGGGTALQVIGPMTITSSALVSNLNADMVDGLHASSLAKISGGNSFSGNQYVTGGNLDVSGWVQCDNFRIDQTPSTGSATATFPGTNKPGSTTTCEWVTINLNGTNKYIPVWG